MEPLTRRERSGMLRSPAQDLAPQPGGPAPWPAQGHPAAPPAWPGTPAWRPSALASPGPPSCPPAWPGASWTREPNLPPQALQGRNNSWEVLEAGFPPKCGPPSFRWKDSAGSRRGLSWQVCPSGLPSWIQNLSPPPLCGLRAPRSLSLWNHCPVLTRALRTPLSTSLQSASGS